MATENGTLQTQEVEKQEVSLAEGAERTRPGRAYVPRVDIYELEDALTIVADMPGVDENSLDITLEKNVLSLKGLVDLHSPDNFALAYAEYRTGDFERSFSLSDGVDQDNITATIKNGVLKIRLPKAGPAKARKVTVSAA
ncbi:MAG TPA: Hsp20/alpha crystallin family protein [Anaerolineae bacterium]|nr:Hsp20/alpha crystallin family protein [Anaerolineae bacterium]